MKRALCVGINDYPNPANRLGGCVNDATDWWNVLTGQFGFEAVRLLDGQATRKGILARLREMMCLTDPEDVLVFTYSGHGTTVPDHDGDEPDNVDEALYVYDGVLLDDELRDIFRRLVAGARLVCFLDSCHSGTATREVRSVVPGNAALLDKPVRRRCLYPERDMNEVLFTGCTAKEYSYDAVINGRANGAFTAGILPIIEQHGDWRYFDIFNRLRKALPSAQYPQRPQLEGSRVNRARRLFE